MMRRLMALGRRALATNTWLLFGGAIAAYGSDLLPEGSLGLIEAVVVPSATFLLVGAAIEFTLSLPPTLPVRRLEPIVFHALATAVAGVGLALLVAVVLSRAGEGGDLAATLTGGLVALSPAPGLFVLARDRHAEGEAASFRLTRGVVIAGVLWALFCSWQLPARPWLVAVAGLMILLVPSGQATSGETARTTPHGTQVGWPAAWRHVARCVGLELAPMIAIGWVLGALVSPVIGLAVTTVALLWLGSVGLAGRLQLPWRGWRQLEWSIGRPSLRHQPRSARGGAAAAVAEVLVAVGAAASVALVWRSTGLAVPIALVALSSTATLVMLLVVQTIRMAGELGWRAHRLVASTGLAIVLAGPALGMPAGWVQPPAAVAATLCLLVLAWAFTGWMWVRGTAG